MHSRALLATLGLLLASLAPPAHSSAEELQSITLLIERNQSREAAAQLNHYLKTHPQDSQAKFLQGIVFSQTDRKAEAILVFNELIKRHPSWPEPYNNLAVLYARQGEFERSRQLLETAMRTHPSYAAVHENLSGIYAAMASEAYGKAFKTGTTTSRQRPQLEIVSLPVTANPSLVLAQNSSTALPTSASSKGIEPPSKSIASIEKIKPVAKSEASANLTQEKVSAPAPGPQALTYAQSSTPQQSPPAIKVALEPQMLKETAQPPTKVTPPAVTQVHDARAEVEDTVRGWAKAWSRQDVDDYLAYYANNFKPPKGESRREWEQQRRSRIKAPQSIEVTISSVQISIDGNRARVSFKQSYRADRIAKRTGKTLLLQNNGQRWRIVQELAR